jgi:hypothetical protein
MLISEEIKSDSVDGKKSGASYKYTKEVSKNH